MIFAVLRLGFLLTPVVVAENRISLRRPWELSRGNFWRIFAIALAIVIPLALLAFLLMLLVVGWAPFGELHAGRILRPGAPAKVLEISGTGRRDEIKREFEQADLPAADELGRAPAERGDG